MREFDAIVIGTGQSGPSLAVDMARAGLKTAIIERKRFGGTCVNTGCIPTKTLVASARAAWVARHGGEYGVVVDGVKVDMKRVKARKDEIVGGFRSGVESWLEATSDLTVLKGHGRFTGPREVEVNGETLRAARIVINVGGRAYVPDMPGLADTPYFTNSTMLEVDFLPEHLVVIGGSYIGLEFAQMYRRFGSRVSVVEKGPRLLPREDPDISDAIRAIVEKDGVEVFVDATCIATARRGDGVAVRLDDAREIVGSHQLVAVGRVPNTDDLGLERAGVEVDKRGYVRVDDRLRTSVDGIWATGDVNGRGAFTHTSYNDYEILRDNLLHGGDRKVTDRIPAYALYIDPPLGRCGMSEREARESGRRVLRAIVPMARVGRAKERGETDGFMKLLVDADTRRILGASLLGISCDEVVHTVLDVMYADAPYTVIANAMHIHPTVSEFLPVLAHSLEPLGQ
jgi:pyruvate/2-oxoglutarate dehydrogenase complex dihydrolipoamide dehydrogenase (E3) component